MPRPATVAFGELQPSLAQDAAAYAPGYQPVPEHVNRAIAEHGLRTMSTVDLD